MLAGIRLIIELWSRNHKCSFLKNDQSVVIQNKTIRKLNIKRRVWLNKFSNSSSSNSCSSRRLGLNTW